MATSMFKATKKEMFTEISGILAEMGRTDLVEFVEHEIELVAKKSTTHKSKAKVEFDDLLKTTVAQILADGVQRTASDVYKEVAKERTDVLPQKIVSTLTAMVKDGAVDRQMVKRVPMFSLIVEG